MQLATIQNSIHCLVRIQRKARLLTAEPLEKA